MTFLNYLIGGHVFDDVPSSVCVCVWGWRGGRRVDQGGQLASCIHPRLIKCLGTVDISVKDTEKTVRISEQTGLRGFSHIEAVVNVYFNAILRKPDESEETQVRTSKTPATQ